MRRAALTALLALLAALALAVPAGAIEGEEECAEVPRSRCFGLTALEASLSTTQAGAHPDLHFSFEVKQDPLTEENLFGGHEPYAPVRDVRFELPPGLIGDPGVLGTAQQCTALELAQTAEELQDRNVSESGCPNGSQIGIATIYIAGAAAGVYAEPIYMMQPPGGEVIARLGIIALVSPFYIDATLRSEDDYGIDLEIVDAPAAVSLPRTEGTTWGVPAAKVHDTERCTPNEVLKENCIKSPPRPPGNRELPFLTNPTRCGVPLEMRVGASSWVEPEEFKFASTAFPQISGCDSLPFGPSLRIEPTSHRAATPTGLEITETLPASEGVEVLEPSQVRDIRVTLPAGLVVNPASADGLDVCSEAQVRFGKRVAAQCPDASKLAEFEAEIPALPRRLRGAFYLRAPEPGNLFRVWVVADDLGAHVKLPGQLLVDEASGQIQTVIEGFPQAPLREAQITLKSGLRAPLANPEACGTYEADYEFTPWSGALPLSSRAPMRISEGCDEVGGFSPKLDAGSLDPTGGARTQFAFTLTRRDGEQNPASLQVTLPKGLSASLAGIPRCEGAGAQSGNCPADSRIGRVIAAVGVGPQPLWVPQPGKRPTAVYLAGPYKGAPLSVIAVVPAQAGPFDLGEQVVRSAVFLDPDSAQGTVVSDPLPQIIEGVPVRYRTVQVLLDRAGGFTINPTSCAPKSIAATILSSQGALAHPSSPFTATGCAKLGFKPKLDLRLYGGTHRGAHPRLRTRMRMPQGGANIGSFSVALPHSEFLDQAHIKTVCTRVQFRAKECPAGSIYGQVKAITPILEEPLSGPIYLRSSDNPLPDMVAALKGPPSLPVEVNAVGRIDSVNGGIRATFEAVPDAPVSEIVASFPGGKKGLIVNSTDLCQGTHRVTAKFNAQNGKAKTLRPALRSKCKGKGRKGR
jgi:hypothetical protein